MQNLVEQLNFKNGLIPAVIADNESKMPLTLCYLNEEALRKSLNTGIIHLFRRSKGKLMKKGGTSGHTQKIEEVRVDCAENSLLIYVSQKVAACHNGFFSCYYRRYNIEEDRLEIEGEKVFDPDAVY